MDTQETTRCENCKTRSGKPVQFYFAKKTSTTNDKSVKTIGYDIALSQPVPICFECAKKEYQKQIPRVIQAALGALAIGVLLFFFGPIISFDQLIMWQILGGIVMAVGFLLMTGAVYEFVMLGQLHHKDDTSDRLDNSRKLVAIALKKPDLIAEGYDTFWTTLPRNVSRDS
jgi:hypothetical protein